jgi:hypothetical protein
MAQLKSTNVTGNLSVTGNILASKIIKLGGTENELLLASGGVITKAQLQAAITSNTWRPVKYDTTTLTDSSTTLEFVAGSNIGLTFSGGKLTIANNYSYSLPLAASGTRGGIQLGYSSTENNLALNLSAEQAYVSLPSRLYGGNTTATANPTHSGYYFYKDESDTGKVFSDTAGNRQAATWVSAYDGSWAAQIGIGYYKDVIAYRRKQSSTSWGGWIELADKAWVEAKGYLTSASLGDCVTGPSSATDSAIALYDGTTGKKIKNSGATIDANRNLKFNGPGNISWEDGSYHQRIHITDDSTQNTAVFTFQQTEDTAKTWNDLFTIQDRGTIIAKNSTGGALSLTLDRGSNANWRWLSDNGNFIAQCDYTSKKGNYFNVLTMGYNTGNVSVDRGTLTSNGGFIHGGLTAESKNDYVLLAGGSTKPLSEFGISGSIVVSDKIAITAEATKTTRYLTFVDSNSTSNQTVKVDDDIYYTTDSGYTWSSFNVGRDTGNGILTLHRYSGTSDKYVNLKIKDAVTTNYDVFMPPATGTIATQEWVGNNMTSASNSKITITASGKGLSGTNSFTLNQSSAKNITLTLDSSTAGNRTAEQVVIASAKGQIDSEKYAITNDSGNVKATWQYNSSTDCVELMWA